ncbi:MAG TPA: hypothetical protein VMH83_09070 [Candidatus Acidoferrum sp.]|nr:hypothetical protein [Candidatus Acidoferrum sp.]
MTAHYNDQELIDRYLNGKLTPSERTAFEVRLLDEPQLLEQVQIVDAMKSALTGERENLPAGNASGSGFRLVPFGVWIQQPLSLAACLMMVVFGLQLSHSRSVGPADDKNADAKMAASAVQSLGVSTLVQLEASRGTESTRAIGNAPYLFKVDAGIGNDARSFVFTLHDAASNSVLTQPDLKADNDGWVWVVVNGQLSGDYRATLSWVDAGGAAKQRDFALTLPH